MKAAHVGDARVLLVDDHPTFREGLRSLIEHTDGVSVCAEADSESSAMRKLEASTPDLMIVDLNLGDDSGLRLIHRARQAFSKLHILVASMYDELMYGERAINAGANGYICKQDDPHKLVEAIEVVRHGGLYISNKLANRIRERELSGAGAAVEDPVEVLSERELQVFTLIGNGYSTKEIAVKLHVSPKTVDAHRDHVKRKIGVPDNTRLIHRAVQWVLSQ
ncbi:response regulator transcription factor [Congregibacter variabilis]|uniref:Response regulator transcription factor n=1 Tax=Congregibacter variabilis TaxID=3081200 RepID=A0ABZ0I3B7_9GAMM|nr:response regulator transcription factor [Congregibacter sp. IMCC43200]